MIKSSFRTPGADRLPVGIQVAMVRQRWPPIPPTAVDLSIVIGCVSRPATGPQAPGKRRWRRRLKNDPATPYSKFPTPISCTRRALRKGFCRRARVLIRWRNVSTLSSGLRVANLSPWEG